MYLGYFRSAAAWRLAQFGDAATYATLTSAVGKLSAASLAILEEELEFFTETGFVGPQISELLATSMRRSGIPIAAAA